MSGHVGFESGVGFATNTPYLNMIRTIRNNLGPVGVGRRTDFFFVMMMSDLGLATRTRKPYTVPHHNHNNKNMQICFATNNLDCTTHLPKMATSGLRRGNQMLWYLPAWLSAMDRKPSCLHLGSSPNAKTASSSDSVWGCEGIWSPLRGGNLITHTSWHQFVH